MEFLLLRHGAVPGNLKRQYIGSTDQPLAPEGESQARLRRNGLPPVDRLWVSPMLRCVQTAGLLFPGMEQIPVPELRECDFGDFEGKTWDELKDNPVYQRCMAGGQTAAFPNGESTAHFLERSGQGMEKVFEEAMSLQILRGAVVTHGGTIMSVMSRFALPHKDFYGWQVKNCGGFLTRISKKGNSFTLTMLEEL